jgi:uncharacterized protein YbjT (DUF2867 family)
MTASPSVAEDAGIRRVAGGVSVHVERGVQANVAKASRFMILVIGATGAVGSEVVRCIAAAGERPRVFVRDAGRARRQFGEVVEYVTGDLNRPETIVRTLHGVDRVFLATTQSERQPEWERRVICAARQMGPAHIVKLSVFRADQRSPLRIARQHREAEQLLEQSGLALTILRPVFFMQNLVTMVRDGVLATAARDGRVSMVDARDVASVAASALTGGDHEGQTYTLTGPEAHSFDDIAGVLSQHAGTRIRHMHVRPDMVGAALRSAGRPSWFANDMEQLHTMLSTGYEDIVTDDISRVTGTRPRSVAQFADDYADALAESTATTSSSVSAELSASSASTHA